MAFTPVNPTPAEWVEKLEEALMFRKRRMELMERYYSGRHPLPFLTKAHNAKMHDEFKGLLEDSRSNFMQLVVEATEERLQVQGYRLSATTDAQADKDTWDIWQANSMDQQCPIAFNEALVKGVSYLSVWYGDKPGSKPMIAVEDPTQTIVAYTAGSNFLRRDAALKIFNDEWTGVLRATLYLPDSIHKFQSNEGLVTEPARGGLAGQDRDKSPRWVPWLGDEPSIPNPLGVVPIIPLRNRPRLLTEGESEFESLTDIQDRINGILFMRALAGYFGAHKQRWAVGLKIMEDDQTGEPIEPFDVAVDRLLQTENPDVKFGEFSATDLTGYIKAIEQDVQHIAVISRTPKHYLIPEGQEPSGDALETAESGLVKKCMKKQAIFGEGLEEALNLARQLAGLGKSPVDSEVVWASPMSETRAVTTDAAIKQFQAGLIPWEGALELLGYSQTQIARYKRMRMSDMLQQAAFAPPTVQGGALEGDYAPEGVQDKTQRGLPVLGSQVAASPAPPVPTPTPPGGAPVPHGTSNPAHNPPPKR